MAYKDKLERQRALHWRSWVLRALTTTAATVVLTFMVLNPMPSNLIIQSPNDNAVNTQHLHLKPDGTFQIGIFTDMHFGEAEDTEWGPLQDVKTARVMDTVLSKEHMDFAVLNGDLVTGESVYPSNGSLYIDRVVEPLVRHGMPWGSAYGNHDSSVNITKDQIFARETRYTGSMTSRAVAGGLDRVGVSNYYLPVYASRDANPNIDGPELIMWFFDTRDGWKYQGNDRSDKWEGYDAWVHQDVIDWFRRTAASLTARHGRAIPSVAFFHIPVTAHLHFQLSGVDAHRNPGRDDERVSPQGTQIDGDNTKYAGEDIPFMEALLEAKQKWGLMATFSGHDHGISWCHNWRSKLPGMDLKGNGLNLCFGAITGYGGYGHLMRGSRQIVMTKDSFDVETYIRYEDGSINNRVSLNATYGQDIYPAVPLRETYLYPEEHPSP